LNLEKDQMKHLRLGPFVLCALLAPSLAHSQSSQNYRTLLTQRVRADKPPAPANLKAYVQDGKIRLSLRDTILLALENNSDIQIEETSIESRKFSLLGTWSPFDPAIQANLNINRYSNSGYSQLQGIGVSGNGTLNTLTQSGQINYLQTFLSGTNINVGLSSSKSSTNSSFYFFNPYFSTNLNLQFTQPLLRNFGKFANTAPIRIAQRGLAESKATFEAEVNDAVLQVVSQYWSTVQSRGALDVQERALKLSQASYDRDKRALELGALPPLDISRSESEVAARKVQLIQSQYALTQAEEALRYTIGANQDSKFRSLVLELTESPEPAELEAIDADTVLNDALSSRPEIEAANDALLADQDSVRLAHNQLRPDLELNGFYQSSGLGGNQYSLTTGQLTSTGGIGTSFNQLVGFGFPGYGGQLTLNLPVRNRAGQARLGNSLVARTRDLYTSRQVEEQIARQARDALNQFDSAKLSLAAAESSQDLARKSLAADQRKFELGAETNFFVLDSQSRLANAELVLLQTRISYQLALAAIHHASGKLLAPYHLQIEAMSK
jgi:outer membrane protein